MKLLCLIIFLFNCGSINSYESILAPWTKSVGERAFIDFFSEGIAHCIFNAPTLKSFEKMLKLLGKTKKLPCIIEVNELSNQHPNFIQLFSAIIIPKKGVIQFVENEQFQVDCVQSVFSNGMKIKNVTCDGNNKYIIDGIIVDLSAFNKCKEKIKVTEVQGEPCLGGVMTDMVFNLPKGRFKLYSACYDINSLSTIYVHYKLYGKAFGE